MSKACTFAQPKFWEAILISFPYVSLPFTSFTLHLKLTKGHPTKVSTINLGHPADQKHLSRDFEPVDRGIRRPAICSTVDGLPVPHWREWLSVPITHPRGSLLIRPSWPYESQRNIICTPFITSARVGFGSAWAGPAKVARPGHHFHPDLCLPQMLYSNNCISIIVIGTPRHKVEPIASLKRKRQNSDEKTRQVDALKMPTKDRVKSMQIMQYRSIFESN